ncbi:Heat shock 70 kDa protein BIP2 [Linum perenne]
MEAKASEIIGGDVIGIDLGTTFSCVAVEVNGKIEVIANDQGNRITPSSIAFTTADNEHLIGDAAKNQAALNPSRTIFDIKRLIGKKFDDEEVQRDLKYLPYNVVNKEGKPYVEVEKGKLFSPEEISAMVLTKMKETAESYLGKPVDGAVVTVPAYFNDTQRQATKEAGRIAGLKILRIINEPTAGALAYGLNNRNHKVKRKILVYDLGGGTFDVSVMDVKDDVFEVLATGGDTHLGGVDFDRRVMDYFIDLIKKKHGMDISRDTRALGKLRKECERAKRSLSSQTQVRIEIEYFLEGGKDFSEILTRAKFEELNMDLFKKTLDMVTKTLEDAKVEKMSNINEIVLVGGSTRIPKLREMLKDSFDGKGGSTKCMNPDEAVAYGAALLGAKLSGKHSHSIHGFTMTDVTPLTLGVESWGGTMLVVIPKNTAIPATMSKILRTVEPLQRSSRISIFQGERSMTKDCLKLGSFVLQGIPPAPAGVSKMNVTFDIDEDGILRVTAKDTKLGNSNLLTINRCIENLTAGQVGKMVREAKIMEKEDKGEKARIMARNCLKNYIYDLEEVAKHHKTGDKKVIDNSLMEASDWLKNNQNASKDDFEMKKQELTKTWNRLTTATVTTTTPPPPKSRGFSKWFKWL